MGANFIAWDGWWFGLIAFWTLTTLLRRSRPNPTAAPPLPPLLSVNETLLIAALWMALAGLSYSICAFLPLALFGVGLPLYLPAGAAPLLVRRFRWRGLIGLSIGELAMQTVVGVGMAHLVLAAVFVGLNVVKAKLLELMLSRRRPLTWLWFCLVALALSALNAVIANVVAFELGIIAGKEILIGVRNWFLGDCLGVAFSLIWIMPAAMPRISLCAIDAEEAFRLALRRMLRRYQGQVNSERITDVVERGMYVMPSSLSYRATRQEMVDFLCQYAEWELFVGGFRKFL